MRLFLGVDGGQSSTVALIADETGRVLGSGRAGPCNHAAAGEGRMRFRTAIENCLGGACRQAGFNPATVAFEAACLGFSGGTHDKDAHSREFIKSSAFKITIDAEIALTGATGGKPGIIVVAGTGSIAFGKDREGEFRRAGGWGYIFGDEGGAFDIVRQSLKAALAFEEGWGEQTALHASLLSVGQAASANELLHTWYNSFERNRVAGLASVVDEVARQGDAVARHILRRSGAQLAELVSHVHKTLFQPDEKVPVASIGGVFASQLVSESLSAQVFALTNCVVERPLWPPAAGAVWEALRLSGVEANLTNIPEIKT